MAVSLERFYQACPGVVNDRSMDAALAALPATASNGTIVAAITPLIPDGNVPIYTEGQPTYPPNPVMPGSSPVFAAALPPQPTVQVTNQPTGADAIPTTFQFQKGLPLFQDSNPDWFDNWSIEMSESFEITGPL